MGRIATRQLIRITAVALAVALTTSVVQARNCSQEEKAAADKQLWLNKADKQRSLERNLPWGVPTAAGISGKLVLLIQRDYVIGYDAELRVPVWTAHRLDAKGLGKSERLNCFRRDPRLKTSAASSPADYKEPIFDQGHLTPNADMSKSATAVINSFVMSNMTPQTCQFNRGIWQIFESLVRLWAVEKGTVYVLTGSIFDRDHDGKPDADPVAKRMKSSNGKARVAIPTHFYKVLLYQNSDGTVEALAVILPHDQADIASEEALKYLTDHVQSISDVEALTGLTLFPQVSGEAAKVKTERPRALWPFKGRIARSLVDAKCRATAGADI